MAGLIVKAECAMVRFGDRFVTLLKDALIPEGADADHVRMLVDRGMVAEGDAAVGAVVVNRPAPFQADATVDDVDGDGPIPPKSATKDVWVDYAVAQGADRAQAEAATKDDLITTYGGA